MTIRVTKSTVALALGALMFALGVGALVVALTSTDPAPEPAIQPATSDGTSSAEQLADQKEGLSAFVDYCEASQAGGGPIECDPFYAWREQNYTSLSTDFPGAIPQTYIIEAAAAREKMAEATTPTNSPTDPLPADEQSGFTEPGERVEPGTAKCRPGYVAIGNEESEGCFPK